MDIAGKAAIVSGAASGMGAATAIFLAEQGAKVALLDINQDAAKQVAKTMGGLAVHCDVSNSESATAAIAKAEEKHGVATMLVNCAGIAPAKKVIGRAGVMSLADFQKVITVNLIGSFNLIRLAAERMQSIKSLDDEERGVIINTASIAAYEGQIGQAAYSASKGGIVAMTLPLAREFAQSAIRVMTIAPGLVKTPLLLAMPEEVQDSLKDSVPFPKRFAEPDEFAKLVGHIINNAMLNGEVIRLDGAIRLS